MWKFRNNLEPSPYTFDQIDDRNKYIPSKPDTNKGIPISVEFADESALFNISRFNKKTLPPSIEYLSDHKSGFLGSGNKISRLIKQNFFEELHDDAPQEFVFDVEKKGHELSSLSFEPEEEISGVVLASSAKMEKLNKLHVDFYSLLVKIQEANIASEFKVAYGIQDKISSIIDNRPLQIDKLVDDLIVYLGNIIEKMSTYKDVIYQRQKRFADFSFRISRLKEYRYKTDQSFKLLDENNVIAEYEIEKNLKALGEKPE